MDLAKMTLSAIFKKSLTEATTVTYWDGETLNYGEGETKYRLTFNQSVSGVLLEQDPLISLTEMYMDGKIELQGDLQKFIESLYSSGEESFIHTSSKMISLIGKWSNHKKISKENVQYHYDIGNDFYQLWLDESMTYSCGYFQTPEDSLYQAQKNKAGYVLKKLHLEEGQRFLDIGCGWGELIIRAAKEYGAKSFGITLSEEQFHKVQERILAEGLEGQVEVALQDYREIRNRRFDRIVSVGMLEHVGKEYLKNYFSQVQNLLTDQGVSLVHSITMPNEGANNRFLNQYIFPGGYVPGIKEIMTHIAELGFYVTDAESLRRHYGRTLECWSENFQRRLEKIRAMKDERFIRMWQLFLYGCAASFNMGNIDLHQIVFTKNAHNGLPWTRTSLYQ